MYNTQARIDGPDANRKSTVQVTITLFEFKSNVLGLLVMARSLFPAMAPAMAAVSWEGVFRAISATFTVAMRKVLAGYLLALLSYMGMLQCLLRHVQN
jgi:hypothetical protein